MLKYNGTVETVSSGIAKVIVDCSDNCENCHGCSNSKKTIEVENLINASVGDKVEVVIEKFNNKLVTSFIYIIPIIATLILVLSLMNFVSTLILCFLSLICFIFFVVCGIIVSSKLIKKTRIKIIKREK